jgi:flagellar secretion chaperone FliS
MNHPAHAYRQFSVQGATPLSLVVMLYDGVIAALLKSVTAIEAHDIQDKCLHLNRAQAIILQLEGTLNMELGGEAAQTLKAFYLYSRGQVLKANIENSAKILRALIEKFTTVREAWYEADQRPSAAPLTRNRAGSSREAWNEAPEAERPSPSAPVEEDSPYASSDVLESRSWRLTG